MKNSNLMRMLLLFSMCLPTIFFVDTSFAAEPRIVIFTADVNMDSLVALEDERRSLPNTINMSMPTRAEISNIEILSGAMHEQDRFITMDIGAHLPAKLMRNVLFLARRKADGSLTARWWILSRDGQCVPELIARDLNIENELQELYSKGSLNCLSHGNPPGK